MPVEFVFSREVLYRLHVVERRTPVEIAFFHQECFGGDRPHQNTVVAALKKTGFYRQVKIKPDEGTRRVNSLIHYGTQGPFRVFKDAIEAIESFHERKVVVTTCVKRLKNRLKKRKLNQVEDTLLRYLVSERHGHRIGPQLKANLPAHYKKRKPAPPPMYYLPDYEAVYSLICTRPKMRRKFWFKAEMWPYELCKKKRKEDWVTRKTLAKWARILRTPLRTITADAKRNWSAERRLEREAREREASRPDDARRTWNRGRHQDKHTEAA